MDDIETIRDGWDEAARTDPMFHILTKPGGWDEGQFFETGVAEIQSVFGHLEELGLDPRGRALDFGCGIGRATRALAERFGHVDGVDVSPVMIARAGSHERCEFRVNETTNLALFADETFDFVYSFIVLQHMARPLQEGYVREFIRVLKPEGVAVFQIPEGKDSDHAEPWLSMRGTSRAEVEGWLAGAELLDVQSTQVDRWLSHRYFVRHDG